MSVTASLPDSPATTAGVAAVLAVPSTVALLRVAGVRFGPTLAVAGAVAFGCVYVAVAVAVGGAQSR